MGRAHLSQTGRVTPDSASDAEVIDAFSLLMKTEGIIPALESAHGLAGGFKRAKTMQPDQNLVINLSGRGDKDIFNIARAFPQAEWTGFLQREALRSKPFHALCAWNGLWSGAISGTGGLFPKCHWR